MRAFKSLFFAVFCGVVLGGCAGSSEPTSRKTLEREFQAEFGFRPSQQITELRCRIVWVGDSWTKWMLFTLDETAVRTMIGGGFIPADPASLARTPDLTTPNANTPEWWRQPNAKEVRIYYKEGHPKDVAGYRYFWIDGDTKTVYAKCAAWR